MPSVAVKGSVCSGHDCFPPRPNIEASSDVKVNGKGVHREGDKYEMHSCPDKGSHDAVLAKGSSTVNINGKPAGRIGDEVSCGSVVADGSANVKIGG